MARLCLVAVGRAARPPAQKRVGGLLARPTATPDAWCHEKSQAGKPDLQGEPTMQLSDPSATPLDVRFRLFGTDVRIHPLFWLITALLGWRSPQHAILPGNGIGDVLVWVLCAFFSILLHEF